MIEEERIMTEAIKDALKFTCNDRQADVIERTYDHLTIRYGEVKCGEFCKIVDVHIGLHEVEAFDVINKLAKLLEE